MSINCCLQAISRNEAETLAFGSKPVGEVLYSDQPKPLLPLGCAVLSLLPCAFIAVQLVRFFPAVKWLSISAVAIFWGLFAQLPQRVWAWASRSRQNMAGEPPKESRSLLHLEKSWAGLHFLLTGTEFEGEEPLCYLVQGGQEVGMTADGPVRLLSPEQVRQFRQALSTITPSQLRDRYDPVAMMRLQVYPCTWDQPEELGWLLDEFGRLRSFLNDACTDGDSVVVSMG
jgi:Domain of unknown function (DUF1877)